MRATRWQAQSRAPRSAARPSQGARRRVSAGPDGAEAFGACRSLRRSASGRIRAMEYSVYRLLETSHAT